MCQFAMLRQEARPDAAWGERLKAAFMLQTSSGSLHSALVILVVDSSLMALRSR
jgi:hypothetical protein